MTTAINSIANGERLINQAVNALDRVKQSIKTASTKVGVDFSYLLNKATQESSLDPTAKAKTSSATGLFQFIDQTWLRMVKQHGEKYGLGELADKISIGSDGVARVADKSSKQEILNLRKDPTLSACMAAELTKANCDSLKSEVGGKIGSTELYLAHFLGAGGAADFLQAYRNNPQGKAADVLPTAAGANQNVFYDKSGEPRSLASIYQMFARKFEGGGNTVVANNTTAPTEDSLRNISFNDYTLADTASYTPSLVKGFAPQGQSLFSTMLLAQMPLHDEPRGHDYHAEQDRDEEQRRRLASQINLAA